MVLSAELPLNDRPRQVWTEVNAFRLSRCHLSTSVMWLKSRLPHDNHASQVTDVTSNSAYRCLRQLAPLKIIGLG